MMTTTVNEMTPAVLDRLAREFTQIYNSLHGENWSQKTFEKQVSRFLIEKGIDDKWMDDVANEIDNVLGERDLKWWHN